MGPEQADAQPPDLVVLAHQVHTSSIHTWEGLVAKQNGIALDQIRLNTGQNNQTRDCSSRRREEPWLALNPACCILTPPHTWPRIPTCSGPLRFEYDATDGKWRTTRDRRELFALLAEEVHRVSGVDILKKGG